MAPKFGIWWRKIKQHPVRSAVIIIASTALFVVLVLGYWLNWNWTGFGPYIPPVKDSNFQRGKTLWDWLQLLVIPIVLAVGGFWLNQVQKGREVKAAEERSQLERKTAEQRAQTEREIALDNQREAALQAYLDSMAELLLHENLCNSEAEHDVRNIASVRTLTVLSRLDPKRKEIVLQFLIASQLIDNEGTILNLARADLSGVHLDEGYVGEINLHGTNLSGAYLDDVILLGANLSEANLFEAHLTGTTLFMANLHKANLLRADLYRAELRKADLSEADLSEANLQRVDLREAKMTKAILRAADLREADLSGANLKGATGTINEELEKKAKSLKGAIMPDGSIYP